MLCFVTEYISRSSLASSTAPIIIFSIMHLMQVKRSSHNVNKLSPKHLASLSDFFKILHYVFNCLRQKISLA